MISKKIATALGTGTLGASGAAGAAAWKLGLLGNKITLSGSDIKAISSSNWKTEKKTESEIAIKIEEAGGETWKCTIKGFIFSGDKSKSKIEEQVKKLVEEINSDETKRNKFVENCAAARLNKEIKDGKDSTIELEVVEESGGNLKLKDLDNLLSGEFIGLGRFEKGSQINHEDAEDWSFVPGKDGDTPKVELKKSFTETFCTIYGNTEKAFDKNKFDYGPLSKIFTTTSKGQQKTEEDIANHEKRKFLIRNCLKYNGKIEGMKMVLDSEKWRIENLEEKLLTKIYEK